MESPEQKFLRLIEHKLGLNLQEEDEFIAIPESTWEREGFDRYDVHQLILKYQLFKIIDKHATFEYSDDLRVELPAKLGYTLQGPQTLDSFKADYLLRVKPDEREKLDFFQIDRRQFELVRDMMAQWGKRLSFDTEKSILVINGEAIKIARQSDPSMGHYILQYIFSQDDRSQMLPFTEISQELFHEQKSSRSFTSGCEEIQKKVREGTTRKIDDFLIFRSGKTGYVQISSKYLP